MSNTLSSDIPASGPNALSAKLAARFPPDIKSPTFPNAPLTIPAAPSAPLTAPPSPPIAPLTALLIAPLTALPIEPLTALPSAPLTASFAKAIVGPNPCVAALRAKPAT